MIFVKSAFESVIVNNAGFGCFAFFAAGMGARAIAGEEEENTMDLLLATPISRSSIVIEKACAMLVCLVCLGIALIVG